MGEYSITKRFELQMLLKVPHTAGCNGGGKLCPDLCSSVLGP